jgi:hypothetical protein
MADQILYRYVATRYNEGHEALTAGGTVTSASTTISIPCGTTLGTNRIVLGVCSGRIDSASFEGSTGWTDASLTALGLFAWANTAGGAGASLSIGNGTKATAGAAGTLESTWTTATKQTYVSLALVGDGTNTVELYDQTTGSGTNNVTCTAPTYGGNFGLWIFVVSDEPIDTPTGWTLVFAGGESGTSNCPYLTILWADADTVSDDTPTLTFSAAAAPELPSRPPVYPVVTHRKPNRALTVAACAIPFVAALSGLEPAGAADWHPTYPDRHTYRQPLNTGGAFAPAPDPIPDAPAPDFSWVPKYPDRVERAYKRPIEGGCFRPTDAITAYYSASATGGATSGSSDRTVAITPAVGDLICAFVSLSGNTNTSMTASDDLGGTYYRAGTALWGTSANIGAVFVRNSLCTSASTHTITVASGANTAGALIAVTAKGMARAGANAVRSFGSQADQASGTAAPVLNQSALFSNMTLVALASGDTTTTAPTGWTERLDTSQATPTTAVEVSTRDFGFEGTTATFGASTSTTFASFIVELDGSPLPAGDWFPTYPEFARGHRPRPHGGCVQPPQDTTTQPLCWQPQWPDFAPGPRPRPRGGVVEALQDDDATPLAWSPTYPSSLRRTVERMGGWSVLATDQIPAEETPVEYWWPSYPDRITHRQVHQAASVVAPLEAATGPTLNAWQPEYPDRVPRPLTRVESAIVATFEAATGTTVPNFWQPSYPDWFAAMSRRAVYVGPFFIELEWDRATKYGWHPTYPDRVDRKQPTLTRGYTLTVVPQDDESPERAWQPTYPDWFPPARLSYGDHWGTFHYFLGTAELVSITARTPTTAPFTPTRSIVSLTETQSRCTSEVSSTLSQTATRSVASLTVSESRVDNMSYEIKVDDLSPAITATLKDQDDAAVNITGATVTFRWRLKGASSWTSGSASITSGAGGTVSYQWTTGQTATAGTYESEWKVTASGNTRTFPSNEYSLFYIRP